MCIRDRGKTVRAIAIFVVLANVLPALFYSIDGLFSDLTSETNSPELIEPEVPCLLYTSRCV